MINITDINAGWLTLSIGKRKFIVSYLTDVNKKLDEIKNLKHCFYPENDTPKLLFFDGEGSELYLTVRKEFNELIILWEEYCNEDKPILDIMVLNYENFIKEWDSLWDRIKEEYYQKFDLDTMMGK